MRLSSFETRQLSCPSSSTLLKTRQGRQRSRLIVLASIVGRTKVNWKNPSSDESRWPDFTDGDQFDKMWGWINTDNMIQSPGLVDIPMCGMDEILNNWKLTKNEYYSWPCDRP